MVPKLIQKYLQEKQARLIWEYCSSLGVISNPLPVSRAGYILLEFLVVLVSPCPNTAQTAAGIALI